MMLGRIGRTGLVLLLLSGCTIHPAQNLADPLMMHGPLLENPQASLRQAEADLAEGLYQPARDGFDASARTFALRGELRPMMAALYGATITRQRSGNSDGARRVLLTALQRMLDRPYPDWYAHFMLALAEIEQQAGQGDRAMLACMRGVSFYIVSVRSALRDRAMLFCADIAADQGQRETALSLLNGALDSIQQRHDDILQAHVLARLGLLQAGRDAKRGDALLHLSATLFARALDFEAALTAKQLIGTLAKRRSPFSTRLILLPAVSPEQAQEIYGGQDCYLRDGELFCDNAA